MMSPRYESMTLLERLRSRAVAAESARRLEQDRRAAAEARDLLRHALEQRGRRWTGEGRPMPGVDVSSLVADADQYVSTNVLRTVARRETAAHAARASNRLPMIHIGAATEGNNPHHRSKSKPHRKGASATTRNRHRALPALPSEG